MISNFLVVGGPVAVGKSTLAQSLGMPVVTELDINDDVQDIVLQKTYEKNRVSPEVIELFFLIKRVKRYKEHSNLLIKQVFDRSIFESTIFAESNLSKQSFVYFKKLWEKKCRKLILTEGKPQVYILLTCSWKVFKERIFSRGREIEIKNFSKNRKFWEEHISSYKRKMIKVFTKFNISYIHVNTDGLTQLEVQKLVARKLIKVGVINE